MIDIHFITDPIINCDFENVYTPAEDTYLILDYFKQKINHLNFDGININKIENILDLGTGTGILAIFFQILESTNENFNPHIFASDILEDSIECAKKNEKGNGIDNKIIFLHSDLFKSFPDDLKKSFNIILFNPPYLPSSELIRNKKKIDYSWNGGRVGNELTIEFLKNAPAYLNKNHFVYCITSSRTNLKEFNDEIKKLGYNNEIVKQQHIFFEDLYLNRLKYLLD